MSSLSMCRWLHGAFETRFFCSIIETHPFSAVSRIFCADSSGASHLMPRNSSGAFFLDSFPSCVRFFIAAAGRKSSFIPVSQEHPSGHFWNGSIVQLAGEIGTTWGRLSVAAGTTDCARSDLALPGDLPTKYATPINAITTKITATADILISVLAPTQNGSGFVRVKPAT